jgi:hypothetical protein
MNVEGGIDNMSIPVDITFHPSWWHKNAGICFNKEFFYNSEYRIEADLKMRQVLFDKFGDLGIGENNPAPRPIIGSDLIASGFLHSELLGCEVHYSDKNPPEVLCRNMSEEEIWDLKVPKLDTCSLWQRIQEQTDYLIRKYGYVEPNINLMGIQNIALDLRGSELFIDYHVNPELAHHLLGLCTEISIEIGRRLCGYSRKLSGGVTAIVQKTVPEVYVTSNCTVEMISLDTYTQFLLPCDKRLAEVFKSFGIHHCGKSMEHVVDGYKLAGELAFAEAGAYSDIAYVRKQLPDVYLNARYSPVKLKDVEPEELKYDICKMLEDGRPMEKLSISCVGIDESVSDRQVHSFLSICRDAIKNSNG